MMVVFRLKKTRDYTVISNHHLHTAWLSLKSKGLLSVMLSLPEDWDYTIKAMQKSVRRIRTASNQICRSWRGLGTYFTTASVQQQG